MIDIQKTAPSSYPNSKKDKVARISKNIIDCILILLILLAAISGFKSINELKLLSNSAAWELSDDIQIVRRAYISGAVLKPGVYEINQTTTVIDLISMAHGFDKAYDDYFVAKNINLAKRIFNEDHIFIPFKSPESGNPKSIQSNSTNALININTATIAQLDELPGVGESTAAKIIDSRPYAKVDDLKEVEGIGDATFAKFKDLIYVE